MNRYQKSLRNIGIVSLISLVISCQTLSSFLISDEDEVEIGAKFKEQIIADRQNYPLYTDKPGYNPSVVKYVDSVGQILAYVQDDRETLHFTFTVINNDTTVNAFAIPGGHVFVYTGLLLEAENGAEVAGVLAHEIGHITKYHGKKMLASQVAVGTINQILFGDSASVALAVVGLLENMAFLKFSRENEFEADSCAVAYTVKAGINPRGMKTFLEKLGKGDPTGKIFEPFSTHPPISDRVGKVQELILTTSNAPGEGDRLFMSEYLRIKSLIAK